MKNIVVAFTLAAMATVVTAQERTPTTRQQSTEDARPKGQAREVQPQVSKRIVSMQNESTKLALKDKNIEKTSSHFPPVVTEDGITTSGWCDYDQPHPCVRVVDLVDVVTVGCDAKWNETCSGTYNYAPPDGWEICRYKAVETSRNKGGRWGLSGASSKNISIKLESWGSGNFLDQWGGWVWVNLQAVRYFESEADEHQRKLLNCDYSNAGGGATAPFVEEAFCAANPKDPGSSIGVQMCINFVYEDGKKKYTSAPYPCGVCTRF